MKTERPLRWIVVCLLLIPVARQDVVAANICDQLHGKVYVYAFSDSPSLEILVGFFDNKSDWEIVFYDLNDSSSSRRFLKIVEIFELMGIRALPRGSCLPCELQYLTWDNMWRVYASPLAGVFRNGRLAAITVGIADYETLDQAVMANADYVKVLTSHDVYALDGEGVKIQLEEFFIGQENRKRMDVNIFYLTSSIIFLALADSVNPCTFSLFSALLLITLHSLGKTKVATTGLSFILAVFVGYYALGLGLFRILIVIPNINKALAVMGLAMGALSIISSSKPEFRSPIPKSVRRFMEIRVSKSYGSPAASFMLGVFATFTLLPCSSGPYLVGVGLVSVLKGSIQAHLLLILYGILFTTPLILILVIVLASGGLSRRIKAFRSTRLSLAGLFSGLLLISACTYILVT